MFELLAMFERVLIGIHSDAIFNSLVTADTLLDPSGRPIIIGSTVPSNEGTPAP